MSTVALRDGHFRNIAVDLLQYPALVLAPTASAKRLIGCRV
jgi:hypothetical protein